MRLWKIFIGLLIFCYDARGMSSYIVKNGDTFSEIVGRYTSPPPPLYGKNGRIARILSFNPSIKNPNHIKIGETIILGKVSKNGGYEAHFELPIKTKKQAKKRLKKVQVLDKDGTGIFDFGLGAGARYYSHTQSGALGSANIGTLFLNNLSLFTSYTRREFGVKMNIDSYKYKYSANSSESEKQLYSYSLQVSYNRFLLGLGVEQQPLFKNSNGTIEMVAESAVLPFLGYKWHIELSEKIKTYLDIQASASYLVDSSASDSSVKISSHSGYGADVKTKLVRKLGSSKRYPLYYFWSNDISYRNYERNVEWSTSSGKANTEQINLNSTIGLKIEF